jgi:hypothetical protein
MPLLLGLTIVGHPIAAIWAVHRREESGAVEALVDRTGPGHAW